MSDTTQTTDLTCDIAVVGAGAAGLSAAVILAQAGRNVLVLDSGEPRNRFDAHMRGFLSRDGLAPSELGELGRAEVERYGGVLKRVRATRATTVDSGTGAADTAEDRLAGPTRFALELDDGTAVRARRLLLAMGLVDELPEVDGLLDHWGGAVFHCPYCRGCEITDETVAVLASGPEAVAEAHLLLQWADDVILLTNDTLTLDTSQLDVLAARGIRVVDGAVVAVKGEHPDRLTAVVFADGREMPCQALLVAPTTHPRRALLDDLGVQVNDEPGEDCVVVPTDRGRGTTVPGVWVAGNLRDGNVQVVEAAADGLRAAIAINADLTKEDVEALSGSF
ncbi:MAG: NAD(P)/FAD-dependent oxidoreductase [Dermatophilaceae bacterium]|nr:NAD(P)/FAD-dependent oxidoreductase [Intrasporangiaceae bacterium]